MRLNATANTTQPSRKRPRSGLSHLTGAEFVARLDLAAAAQRFRDCLEHADSVSTEAEQAADRYTEISGGWPQGAEEIREPQAAGMNLIEIAGSIKWFDAAKGYGFILPDNGLADVLLHVTCLRAGGYQTAHEGARIVCQALVRPKGIQAFRILHMDVSTAIHPSQLPQRSHVFVTPENDWERAMVKWFNRVRGFGYLTRGEGTPDIFVHMETLRRWGFTELRVGQWVQIRYGHGAKGLMVAELRPDGRPNEWTSMT